MAYARLSARFTDVVASVDEANTASVRVLQKLGFQQVGKQIGSFQNLLVMRHSGQISDAG